MDLKEHTELFASKLSNVSSSFWYPEQGYYRSCGTDRRWWIFLVSTILTPVVLYFFLSIWALIKFILTKVTYRAASRPWTPTDPALPEDLFGKDAARTVKRWELPWAGKLEKEASRIVLIQSRVGHLIGIIAFLVAMVSYGIYIYEVADFIPDLEICRKWMHTLTWQIDMGCNLFFLILFIMRYLASSRKFRFLFELYSIVDYCTIPPAFVGFYLNRNWSGLRFMRVLYIFSIPEGMQYVGILKTRLAVRVATLVCQLLSVVFVGSGFFHLIENFEKLTENGHSYGKFVYFAIITLSTVGYGDVSPVTWPGRLFDCFFIMAGLGLFASSIPIIATMLSSHWRYGGEFKIERGTYHIIICGHITYAAANRLLENFFHGGHQTGNLSVVFLSNEDPDLEMEALLKRNFTHVEYLQGDVLDADALRRAHIKDALACLIIANKKPERSDVEDATNIMRVLTIKSAHPSARVIVQIHHSNNQVHLTNLPTWSTLRGDVAVGLSDLKMGILAQSCIAPGFSTLISNLMQLYPIAPYLQPNTDKLETSRDLYAKGCSSQVIFQRLSDFFLNMDFISAARHCYTQLDLVLIGLFERPTYSDSMTGLGGLLINPTSTVISENHIGIFIVDSSEFASRAWFYCKECHAEIKLHTDVKFCGCEARRIDTAILHEQNPIRKFWLNCQRDMTGKSFNKPRLSFAKSNAGYERHLRAFNQKIKAVSRSRVDSAVGTTMLAALYDNTGKSHWIPARTFEDAVMDIKSVSNRPFWNHLLVCIFAESDAPSLEIAQFIEPLRSAGIPAGQLRDIVILGNLVHLEKEWQTLRHFPKIIIVKGNPLDRMDLEAVSIKTCDVCVVISSKKGHSKEEIVDDQEVILATLNLKAIDFEDHFRMEAGQVSPIDIKPATSTDYLLKIISNLEHDENVQFLEPELETLGGIGALCLSESYMSGSVFMDTALDSLMNTTFFNPLSIALIHALVFGSAQLQPETSTGEKKSSSSLFDPIFPHTYLKLVGLMEGTLAKYANSTYKDLVLGAFDEGTICLGISRRIDPGAHPPQGLKRCVIASPPSDLPMRPDDLVYVYASLSSKTKIRSPEARRKEDSVAKLQQLSDDLKEEMRAYKSTASQEPARNTGNPYSYVTLNKSVDF